MVPWKIIASAQSLLNFMSALGIFLAPIASILACDYWVVQRKAIDVPALYRKYGRYRYDNAAGTNWRATAALLIGVVPNLPGMAAAVNPSIQIGGARYIYAMFYLYGFTSSFVSYAALSWMFPHRNTLLKEPIFEDIIVVDGVERVNDGVLSADTKEVVSVSVEADKEEAEKDVGSRV
jgi:nucleobase:cation symporter-1, NCS1 family